MRSPSPTYESIVAATIHDELILLGDLDAEEEFAARKMIVDGCTEDIDVARSYPAIPLLEDQLFDQELWCGKDDSSEVATDDLEYSFTVWELYSRSLGSNNSCGKEGEQ